MNIKMPTLWHHRLFLCPVALASCVSAGSYTRCSTSDPAVCLLPGENSRGCPSPWDPATRVGEQKELLAPGFASAPLWQWFM